MKLLALETTGNHLGACLWEDFRIRATGVDKKKGAYSHHVTSVLEGLFKKVKWSPSDLDSVAVDVGPGRFTGIRMGLSAARTLGMSLQTPVVEVSSLEAMAAQGSGWQMGKNFVWKFPQDLLCVLLDAMRTDVYMAVWRFHRLSDRNRRQQAAARSVHTFGHHFKLVHAPSLFPFSRFLTFFKSCFQEQSLLFAGSAAQRYKKELQKAFGAKARFSNVSNDIDARWVAALGAERFFRREIKSFNQLKPLYLRPSYAEEELAQGRR